MLALIDFNGKENFEKWNQDLKQQIQYVYNLIQEESEYQATFCLRFRNNFG